MAITRLYLSTVVARCRGGFTLLEMLLALALGGLVLGLTLELYISMQKIAKEVEDFHYLQQRVALLGSILKLRVDKAGDKSCVTPYFVDNMQAIRGYNAKNIPFYIPRALAHDSAILLIGSCRHYQRLWQFVASLYFIGKTARMNSKHQPIYALYEKIVGGKSIELIPDVYGLKIRYGIKYSNNFLYLDTDHIVDWSVVRVVKIKVALDRDQKRWIPLYIALREIA